MPEGDTIARAARSLHAWMAGRELTAARSRARKAPVERLVGQNIVSVEAKAKHLLMRFSSGAVLHSHMRMTGSWHVYSQGECWRKPSWRAAVVLEAGDHVAVCFDAPVVELLAAREVELHPALASLGPDVLVRPLDLDEVCRRAALQPEELTIGELLLDQQVVSGVGNIWRSETLFACRCNPWRPHGSLAPSVLDELVTTAARLMSAATDGGRARAGLRVYDRAGRSCARCGASISRAKMGAVARTVYWCRSCQGPSPE